MIRGCLLIFCWNPYICTTSILYTTSTSSSLLHPHRDLDTDLHLPANMSFANTGAYSKPEEFEEKTTPASKWYDPEIRGRMTASAAKFYSEYTGLSSEELIPHLHKHVCACRPFSSVL